MKDQKSEKPKENRYMEFLEYRGTIECIRKTKSKKQCVASFDATLREPPPHVATALTRLELAKLEDWLRDREKIGGEHLDQLTLEAAVEIIERACGVVQRGTSLPDETLSSLKLATIKLFVTLKLSTEDAATSRTSLSDNLEEIEGDEKLRAILKELCERI